MTKVAARKQAEWHWGGQWEEVSCTVRIGSELTGGGGVKVRGQQMKGSER